MIFSNFTPILFILSLFLLLLFFFFSLSHIFTFSLRWCLLLHLAKLSNKQNQNFQIWNRLAQANKTKTFHETVSGLRSEISTQSPAVFLPFLFFKGGVCFSGKFKKDFWFGHDHESASQREKKIVCEIGLLKAETVNRRPSRPRPTPQLLQAVAHRLGLMKTGERKGKKMEESEYRAKWKRKEKKKG